MENSNKRNNSFKLTKGNGILKQNGKETPSSRGEVVGYVRVSTDLQDMGKQEDIIKNWARREKFKTIHSEILKKHRLRYGEGVAKHLENQEINNIY